MHCCSVAIRIRTWPSSTLHVLHFIMYEGVAAFDDIRTAAHVVPDRYLAAAPDDFFRTWNDVVLLFSYMDRRSIAHIRLVLSSCMLP